ncbi:MAG TPA: hypothetical protein VMW56_04200 [Candidatus Margulisiibacteriota bacterium]|nr:hypothetical protein [Candidatus Margulisiibacteriota bacterium]
MPAQISNATLTGWLFFPFNSYVRARVELIDKQTDETEGFSIFEKTCSCSCPRS